MSAMSRDDDYLWDGSGEDAEVAGLERALGGLRHDAPMRPLPPRRSASRARRVGGAVAVAVAVVAIAAAALVLVLARGRGGDAAEGCDDPGAVGFRFDGRGDGLRCGGVAATSGVLPVGAWLETAPAAEAAVRIADIGDVTVLGGSRLRAVATGPDQHRLELARGTLRAKVTAPPRLFVVDTPAATAVDLGCAYELSVDERGQTWLWVTSGAVALEAPGRSAYVPAGLEVATVGGVPGTPVRRDAGAVLRDAAARLDRGDPGALAAVLGEAGECDTVTLWNLLARTDGAARQAVFERLDQLAVRPEWVLAEDVLAGRADAIEAWRADLEAAWVVGLSAGGSQCVGPGSVDPVAPPVWSTSPEGAPATWE